MAKKTTNEGVGPNPEVPERAKRRRFTAEYKLRIVQEAERCSAGELGALLSEPLSLSASPSSSRRPPARERDFTCHTPREGGEARRLGAGSQLTARDPADCVPGSWTCVSQGVRR